jgi:hypothetical protein
MQHRIVIRRNAHRGRHKAHRGGGVRIYIASREHGVRGLDAHELIEGFAEPAYVIVVIGGRVEIEEADERAMSGESSLHLRDHGLQIAADHEPRREQTFITFEKQSQYMKNRALKISLYWSLEAT